MSTQVQSKREILKKKVVALVKEFTETEGNITWADLQKLFGESPYCEVANALKGLKTKLC